MSISASDPSSFFAKSLTNLDRNINIKIKDFVSWSRKRFLFRLKMFKASGVNMDGFRREKIDGAPLNKKELQYAKYAGRT